MIRPPLFYLKRMVVGDVRYIPGYRDLRVSRTGNGKFVVCRGDKKKVFSGIVRAQSSYMSLLQRMVQHELFDPAWQPPRKPGVPCQLALPLVFAEAG